MAASAVDPLAYFSKAGADGVSVRSHLAEIVHKLLLEKKSPAEMLAKLESLSLEVKAAHFDANQPGSKVKPAVPAGSISTLHWGAIVPTEDWLKAAKALFTVDPEVIPLPQSAELPDLMTLFEGAGVGMSKQETYRIYLAMAALKEKHGLATVRFFGKIFGTKADYVIIEGALTPSVHKPPSVVGATPPEPPGVGLNAATYFVAPSSCDEFVQLEDVTPEAVLTAMKIRKYFTGSLSAPVACYPAFPGPESAYLRAQIARIVQATGVFPANRIIFDEESEATPKPLMVNPEYAPPDTLPATDSWVHGYGGILKIGRCTNVPKVVVEGEEEEGEELEEEVEPLKPVSEDPPVATFGEEEGQELPAWSAKLYNTEFGAYGVAVAKSNRWPGAYAGVAKQGDKAACVYFGWGQEQMGKNFTLEPFPTIAAESAEAPEADEVALADENAQLKEIDEAKIAAANAAGEDEE